VMPVVSTVVNQSAKPTTAVAVETSALALPLQAALGAAEQAPELLLAGMASSAGVAAPIAPHTLSLPLEVQPVTPSLVLPLSDVAANQDQRLEPNLPAQTSEDLNTLIRSAEAGNTDLRGVALPAADPSAVLSGPAHPSLIAAAISETTLSAKKDEHQDLLLKLRQDESPVPIAPPLSVGVEKIPAELVAAQAAPRSLHTEPVAPTAQPAVVTPDTISAAISTRDTLRLHLDQPELGRVTMQVTLQAQQVTATVGVEHRGLGDLLTAGQGALTDAMKQHGLRIEQFNIETLGNEMGAGAGRSGLLDHGAPRQDAPGFQREAEARMPSIETSLNTAAMTDRLAQPHSRSRINLFA
jgi:flagellar hook-length control protein FliK